MTIRSEEDFLSASDTAVHVECVECGEPFSAQNTFSTEGWEETQLSGLCEKCFDKLMEDFPEEEDDE